MSNSWDELLRMLVRANPQDFVSLVSSGTHYLSDITQKLITRTHDAGTSPLQWSDQILSQYMNSATQDNLGTLLHDLAEAGVSIYNLREIS